MTSPARTFRHNDRHLVGTTPRTATWAGYAASVWAFVFAAISFYWAVGGTAGGSTIGPA